jgi:hypothetical protein
MELIHTIIPPPLLVAWTLISLLLIYRLGIIVHRLYLHPLRHFPGPKLAAASTLYRAYYQIWRDGDHVGQATRLHEIYGKSLVPLQSGLEATIL